MGHAFGLFSHLVWPIKTVLCLNIRSLNEITRLCVYNRDPSIWRYEHEIKANPQSQNNETMVPLRPLICVEQKKTDVVNETQIICVACRGTFDVIYGSRIICIGYTITIDTRTSLSFYFYFLSYLSFSLSLTLKP